MLSANAPYPGARGLRCQSCGRPNTDALGRDINRRVDVKVLVNKGLDSGVE